MSLQLLLLMQAILYRWSYFTGTFGSFITMSYEIQRHCHLCDITLRR